VTGTESPSTVGGCLTRCLIGSLAKQSARLPLAGPTATVPRYFFSSFFLVFCLICCAQSDEDRHQDDKKQDIDTKIVKWHDFGQCYNVSFALPLSLELIPNEVCDSMPKEQFDALSKQAIDFANANPVKQIFYIVKDDERWFTCVIMNRCVKYEDLRPKKPKSWKFLLYTMVKQAILGGELTLLKDIVRISDFIDPFPM